MWKSKKLTVKKNNNNNKQKQEKKSDRSPFIPYQRCSRRCFLEKIPNLTSWYTINVPVHEKTMKIYRLYLVAKFKCRTGKIFALTRLRSSPTHERSQVRASWPSTWCFAFRPMLMQSRSIYHLIVPLFFFFLSSFHWFPAGPFCFYRPTRVIPHDPHRIFLLTIFQYKCKESHTAYMIIFLIV